MMGYSHVVLGCSAALAVGAAGFYPIDPLVIAAGALGAMAPDIDHPQAWAGRKLYGMAHFFTILGGHRGATHSLLCLGLILLPWFFPEYGHPVLMAFGAGYASHLAADFLTHGGLMLFWPFPAKMRAPVTCSTGGFLEPVIVIGLTGLVIAFVDQRNALSGTVFASGANWMAGLVGLG